MSRDIFRKLPTLYDKRTKKRRDFSIRTKKNEWMLAAGKNPFVDKFTNRSNCRRCTTSLIWGNRRYDFDHRDNNIANNSQKNCYLVCKSCHGEHTVVMKRKVRNMLGQKVGYKTIKKKVGYKKPKKKISKKKSPRKRRKTSNVLPSL